jgi:hypothetical protein
LFLAYPVVAHSRNIWCEESLEMGGSPPPIVVVCVNRIGKLCSFQLSKTRTSTGKRYIIGCGFGVISTVRLCRLLNFGKSRLEIRRFAKVLESTRNICLHL